MFVASKQQDRPSSVMSFLSDIGSDSDVECVCKSPSGSVPLFQLVPLRRKGKEASIQEADDLDLEQLESAVLEIEELQKRPVLKKAVSCLSAEDKPDVSKNKSRTRRSLDGLIVLSPSKKSSKKVTADIPTSTSLNALSTALDDIGSSSHSRMEERERPRFTSGKHTLGTSRGRSEKEEKNMSVKVSCSSPCSASSSRVSRDVEKSDTGGTGTGPGHGSGSGTGPPVERVTITDAGTERESKSLLSGGWAAPPIYRVFSRFGSDKTTGTADIKKPKE